MPIYKMPGKKDGLQRYRVRINFTDAEGHARQQDRVVYGLENAKTLERELRALLNFAVKMDYIPTKSLLTVSKSVAQKLKGADRITPPKNKSSFHTLQLPPVSRKSASTTFVTPTRPSSPTKA